MTVLVAPVTTEEQKLAVAADAVVRRRAPALESARVGTWNEDPVLYRDRTRPWVLVPFERDPLRRPDGGYPFPADVAATLQKVAATGVRFSRIAVAHELTAGPRTDALLATAKDGHVVISDRDARRLVGTTVPATPALATKGRALDRLVMSASTAPLAVADALVLDPIVFGVVGVDGSPTTGRPALYYQLAVWEW